MLHGQLVRIALIVLGLLCSYTGIALADFVSDADSDFFAAVPEPGTLTLLASGAAALGAISWLHRRKK
jgi:hypothetical protein